MLLESLEIRTLFRREPRATNKRDSSDHAIRQRPSPALTRVEEQRRGSCCIPIERHGFSKDFGGRGNVLRTDWPTKKFRPNDGRDGNRLVSSQPVEKRRAFVRTGHQCTNEEIRIQMNHDQLRLRPCVRRPRATLGTHIAHPFGYGGFGQAN